MHSQEEGSQPRDRRSWTEEEDEMLRAAIEEEDPDVNPPTRWHAIAQHLPNRTNKDCRKRWWAQMASIVSKGAWTSDEDERLASAVEELGPKWASVAGRVKTRNSGQCAKRWNDTLNPSIDRSRWTREEDELLIKAVEEQGRVWAHIARTYLPGRTGLATKNRYNHFLRGFDKQARKLSRQTSRVSPVVQSYIRGHSVSSSSTCSTDSQLPSQTTIGGSSPDIAAMPRCARPDLMIAMPEAQHDIGAYEAEQIIDSSAFPDQPGRCDLSLQLPQCSGIHQICGPPEADGFDELLPQDPSPTSPLHTSWTPLPYLSDTATEEVEQFESSASWPSYAPRSVARSNIALFDLADCSAQYENPGVGQCGASPLEGPDPHVFPGDPFVAGCHLDILCPPTYQDWEPAYPGFDVTQMQIGSLAGPACTYSTNVEYGGTLCCPDSSLRPVTVPSTTCDCQDVACAAQMRSWSLPASDSWDPFRGVR
ncbi:hypothetical protein AcW1_001955 [Taiwanofungus camphoratus]|nr:hypothetical protein AcW1_001955 [Antrodia cinnamomea]